jgi:hypothetical protein
MYWLTPFFGVNSSNNISMMFKYLACFLQPLQPQIDDFYTWREKTILLAKCKFTKQLQNVLNILYAPDFLYNPSEGGIYFSNVVYNITTAPSIYYDSPTFATSILDIVDPITFAPAITDNINFSTFIIWVYKPIWDAYGSQIKADVALVAVDGVFYEFRTYVLRDLLLINNTDALLINATDKFIL